MARKRKCDEQPCWDCTHACGGCNWSSGLRPVEGWQAEEKPTEDGLGTFHILYCPEFEKGVR